jgi:hypothetical protein
MIFVNFKRFIYNFFLFFLTLAILGLSIFLFINFMCPGLLETLLELCDLHIENSSILMMFNFQNAINVVQTNAKVISDDETEFEFMLKCSALGFFICGILHCFGIPITPNGLQFYGVALGSTSLVSKTDLFIKYPNVVGGGAQAIAATLTFVCSPMLGGIAAQVFFVPASVLLVNSIILSCSEVEESSK